MRAPPCPLFCPHPHPTWRLEDVSWPRPGLDSDTHSFFQKQVFGFRIFCFVFRNTSSGFRNSFSVSEIHFSFQKRIGRFQNFGEGVFLSVSGTQNPFQKIIFGFRNSVSVSEIFFRFQNPCAGFRILASCFRNVAVFCLRGGLRYQLGVCLGARFVSPFRVFNTPPGNFGEGGPHPGTFRGGGGGTLGNPFLAHVSPGSVFLVCSCQ